MPAELDVLAANIGAGAEAEAQRAAGKRIEILGLAHHQAFARAGAQRGEHRRDLGHLLVVALEVEDHADGRRVTHQRAVALVGLDHQQVRAPGERVARKPVRLELGQDRRR